uniref:Uncharacterized protein n=1 Tax=Anopheles atroparvus TaxID=41427 RepID=A0A182ILE5_ANOAO
MGQRVGEMLSVGLLIAVFTVLREVRSDPGFNEQAEPSHHVMHIRKLTDSDKLKIELEPVWFHLESAEQKAAGESQQVKRQAKQHAGRPVQVFSTVKHLERYQRKNRHESEEESDPAKREPTESFLKDFWHADVPSDRESSHELAQKSTSLDQQLEDIDLPSCFRQYLNEMYDRNNESVRKLMRCLSQRSEESCLEARRAQRLQPYHDRENRENDSHQALYERKVIRRRKFSDHRDNPPVDAGEEEDLKFEKHYIHSDSDDWGHTFNPAADESDSESGSIDSSSADEGVDRVNDVRTQTEDSEEPERREEQRHDPRNGNGCGGGPRAISKLHSHSLLLQFLHFASTMAHSARMHSSATANLIVMINSRSQIGGPPSISQSPKSAGNFSDVPRRNTINLTNVI